MTAMEFNDRRNQLFAQPDLSGRNGVDVHSYDEMKQVLSRKSGHRFDYDSGTFKKARVHTWKLLEQPGQGQVVHSAPAGGTLDDFVQS